MDDDKQQITPVVRGRGITKENAAEMGRIGNEKKKAKAAEGMIAAAEEYLTRLAEGKPVPTLRGKPAEAWALIIKRATEEYLKSSSLRGMSEIATFIGKNTGMINEPSKYDLKSDENHLLGIDDARIVLQVYNYYTNDYKHAPENLDVIDAEINDLSTDELSG